MMELRFIFFIFCHEMLYSGFFLDVQFSHHIFLLALLLFQMTCVEVQFQSVLFKNTSETYPGTNYTMGQSGSMVQPNASFSYFMW